MALAATGCQAHVQVLVDVDPDGSGVVRVGLGLDEEAAAALPDLASQLWVEDLRAGGWRVLDPATEADGRLWVRALRPFADTGEATTVLDQVSGPDGPFGGLVVHHEAGVLRSGTTLRGTVDLADGLEGFADQALRDALGSASPLAPGALEARLGRPLSEVLTVEVVALLPGDVDGNGDVGLVGAAMWQVEPGTEERIVAVGRRWNTAPVAWAALAAAALVALAVVLVARRRRRA